MWPASSPNSNFRYLNDGLGNTLVSSTTAAAGALQFLDFGLKGVQANIVRIGMAIGAWVIPVRNTAGLHLIATDPAGRPIFDYTFSDIGLNGYQFYEFNMRGQLIAAYN